MNNQDPEVLIGDMDVAWHHRYEFEREFLGPYLFGKGKACLESRREKDRDK